MIRRLAWWTCISVLLGLGAVGPAQADDLTCRHSANTPLQVGQDLIVHATGPAGGKAWFQLGQLPDHFPMTEEQPGQYRGSYRMTADLNVNGATVYVKIREERGHVLEGQCANLIGQPEPGSGAGNGGPIASFSVSPRDRVRAGDTVTFTVTGLPGCQVRARLGEVARNVPLTEAGAGQYSGSWQAPDGQPISFAWTPPVVVATTPDGFVGVAVKAEDRDDHDRRRVDPRAIRFFVDDQDHSAEAAVGHDTVIWNSAAALTPGRHEVRLTLFDRDRHSTTVRDSFNVVAVAALKAWHNADNPLQPGDTLEVHLAAPAGGQARFSVEHVVRDVAMTERHNGEYAGRYTVRRDDQINGQGVVVEYTGPDGQRQRLHLARPIGGDVQAPPPPAGVPSPVITDPLPGPPPNAMRAVRGTTVAGGQVEVIVDRTVDKFGAVRVDHLYDKVVTADGNGLWVTEPVSFRTDVLAKTTFTVTAIVTVNGQASTPTVITIGG
jgi:hypothetical protein